MEMNDVVTIAQAAEIAGVHKNTIRQWIKLGRLPAALVKVNRGEAYMIPRASLEALQQGDDHPTGTDVAISQATVQVPANVEAVVQRLFAPAMEQLQNAYIKIGALEERCRQLEAENEQLQQPNQLLALEARIDELVNRPAVEPQSTPAPVVVQPRFRWEWLNRLLTQGAQSVG